jgi:tetratricopeptide (TPR) repeat protein
MYPKGSIIAAGTFALLMVLASASFAHAGARSGDEVCNATADYFLGMEDYGEAIATHRRLVAEHPADALAHYHLGFAYGMTGDREREIAEYRKAAALGLREWDLYLNLGRALLESGDFTGAAVALNTAVALAPERAESHFNLGLTYERRGMFAAAREELRTSLRLDPRQPDARNMIGLTYADERDYPRAREVWNDLANSLPDYEPARLNLAALDRIEHTAKSDTPIERHTMRTAFAPGTR